MPPPIARPNLGGLADRRPQTPAPAAPISAGAATALNAQQSVPQPAAGEPTTASALAHPPAVAKADVKLDRPLPESATRPTVAQNNSSGALEKLAVKADDPFAGLDSLEAEMARMLGREKPS
jgi:hypothetical protein